MKNMALKHKHKEENKREDWEGNLTQRKCEDEPVGQAPDEKIFSSTNLHDFMTPVNKEVLQKTNKKTNE